MKNENKITSHKILMKSSILIKKKKNNNNCITYGLGVLDIAISKTKNMILNQIAKKLF
jgi:hypothetical protein